MLLLNAISKYWYGVGKGFGTSYFFLCSLHMYLVCLFFRVDCIPIKIYNLYCICISIVVSQVSIRGFNKFNKQTDKHKIFRILISISENPILQKKGWKQKIQIQNFFEKTSRFSLKMPLKVRSHVCGCDRPKNPSTHALRTHNCIKVSHPFAPYFPARTGATARTHAHQCFDVDHVEILKPASLFIRN